MALLAGGCLTAAAPAATRAPSVVPINVMPMGTPAPVIGQGSKHLVYELRLTNLAGRPVTLESVEVVDPATGTLLAKHAGAELAAMIRTPGVKKSGGDLLALNPGGFSILTSIPRCQ